MKTLPALMVSGLLVALALAIAVCVIPENVAAVEYSGWSPTFATGASWSLYLGYAGVGDVVEWYWISDDSLSFAVVITPDMTYLYGYSNDDGFVVTTAGHYNLVWTNNNLFFSAQVQYWAAVFTPWTSVAAPSEGAYLDSQTVSVQGMTDPFSYDVYAGRDALHLSEASWSGDNWAVDVNLAEGDNSILVRTIYWLDNYGYDTLTYDKTIHVVVDTIAPELVITHPVNDSYDSGDIETTWQCSDTNGIVKSEIKFDAWGWNEVTGTTYVASMPDGLHTVQVRVTDPAGNQATRAATFTKDTALPELAIISPDIVSGGTYLQDLVEISWQCSDNTGIASQEVRVDRLVWQQITTNPYTIQFADGRHLIEVRVTDLAGNNVTGQISFVTDTVAPVVTIFEPSTDSKISKNDVTVVFGAEDELSGIDHLEVQVDGGNWLRVQNYTSSYELVGLEDGWHSMAVKAVDQSGNTATETVNFGIYTSVWSQNGPYQGIPLYSVIAAVVVVAILSLLLYRRKRGAVAKPPAETPPEGTQ